MRLSRRRYLAAAGAALAAGCTGSDEASTGTEAGTTAGTSASSETSAGTTESPTEAPERTPSVTDVSLLLNWKPSGLHVPYYAAAGEGFYERQGLSLSGIEAGQGSDFSAKQAGLGNESFAVTSADQLLNINSRDLSPVSVGVVMQRSPVVLFAVRENFGAELTDASQLAGKTVGTGPGMVRLLSKLLLEREGVLDSVELVDTGYDTVQRLLSGKIDAAGGVFGDVVDARHQGYTADFVRVADAVPSYGHVLATKGSFAREHPETVRAFLRATARGAAWAHNNPEAAVDHLVEAVPALSESRARQRDKWRLLREEFMLSQTVNERGWGWSTPGPWKSMHEALRGTDLLGGSVDPASAWSNDYLDREFRYVGDYATVISQ